jgi:hypothetical protein
MLLLELLPLKVLQVRGSDLIAPPHFSTGNVGYYIMISSVNPVVEWVNDWLLLIGMLDNLFFFSSFSGMVCAHLVYFCFGTEFNTPCSFSHGLFCVAALQTLSSL